MAHGHLDLRLLERLLEGKITAAEVRELARHLLEVCPHCAEATELDWVVSSDQQVSAGSASVPLGADDAGEDACGVSFDRVRQRLEATVSLLSTQREQAPGLLRELDQHPLERQRILIRNKARFQNLPLAELLLERAWQRGFDDPIEAEAVAELAGAVLDCIEPAFFSSEVLNDLRGRCWAYRGNFRRIASDFRGAEAAFQQAERLQAEGSGDLLEQARLFGLRATFCRDRVLLKEAREFLNKAVKIYFATEESHLAGRSLIELGVLSMKEGSDDEAVKLLERGLQEIDAEQEPRLILVARFNLVRCLANQGRYEEAMALLPQVRRLAAERASRFDLVRLRWLEGKILLGLGHESRAEAAFLEVRKGFVEQGVAYDAAGVNFDLAALYLRQGRPTELKQLAVEMLPILQSRSVHQEAIAALLLFRRAVEMENLTLRMIEEVSEVVRRSQGKPSPRNEEPS